MSRSADKHPSKVCPNGRARCGLCSGTRAGKPDLDPELDIAAGIDAWDQYDDLGERCGDPTCWCAGFPARAADMTDREQFARAYDEALAELDPGDSFAGMPCEDDWPCGLKGCMACWDRAAY